MPEAVIVSALRTPIGTAMKGTLRDTDAYQLAEHVVGNAAADLDPGAIDDVVLGEGLYGGGVVARHAAITAGLRCRGWRRTGTAPRARPPCRAPRPACARAWTNW